MKHLYLLLLVLPISVFAVDQVTEVLKKENEMLNKRIQQNTETINARKALKIDLSTVNLKTKKSQSELILGFESINWGEAQNENIPTIGYSYKFENSFMLGLTYGRFQNNNFPGNGIQTVTNIAHAFMSYDYKTSWGISVRPLLGYVHYDVNSPDAGNFGYQYQRDSEKFEIEGIRDRSGIFSGISVVKELNKNWNASIRGDISKSTSLYLSYKL
jgi:hypothetical protein